MEKKREEDFANQEALRLSGVFNTPIPAQPPEREKALDKVKEPPRVCRSWNGRSGDKETPPPCPSSCDGVRGGTGADPGAHGRGGCP